MMKQYATTPVEINRTVIQFCSGISSNMPVFIPVKPEPYGICDHCFPVVDKKVQIDGGGIVHGWQIWLWPEIYIEAEFHAVWQSPEGILIDPTSKRSGETQILFLPDRAKKYEGIQVNNIRESLSRSNVISDFFKLNDCLFLLMNHGDRAQRHAVPIQGEELDLFEWLLRWKEALLGILQRGGSKNSPCPCGSGEKYKHCCEKEFQRDLNFIYRHYTAGKV